MPRQTRGWFVLAPLKQQEPRALSHFTSSGCRERHLKCDLALPKCRHCASSRKRRDCVYGELRLRHSVFSAASEIRPKTRNPRTETDSLQADIQDESNSGVEPTLTSSTEPWSAQRKQSSVARVSSSGNGYDDNAVISPTLYFNPACFTSQEAILESLPSNPKKWAADASPHSVNQQDRRETSHTPTTVGPNETECSLFRFYKNYAGPLLDIVTPARHLSQTVPRIAVSNPLLYYACLAYAATIMALRGEVDVSLRDHYQSRVISMLLETLSTCSHPEDVDSILASTVILRMSEQFTEINEDKRRHLSGAFSLFTLRGKKRKWSAYQTYLGGVAFWTYIQETIRLCFLNGETCQFHLDLVDEDYTFGPAPDEVWTNRTTLLVVQACDLCFNFGERSTLEPLAEHLRTSLRKWESNIPDSFRPWSYREREFGPFPGIHCLSTWHEIAWQHYYVVQAILGVWDLPAQKSMGIPQLNQYMRNHVLAPARKLCGVCFASSDPGSQINGSHLMSWCAQYFMGPEEQDAVVRWLEHLMEETQWPNKTCSQRLRDIWGGRRAEWIEPAAVNNRDYLPTNT